jgi:uncharacterized membrane protein
MKRLGYIDWLRGLACVLMFQTHCYDSWLSIEARKSPVRVWSQIFGTLPAPLFTFVAGISVALVTERLWGKGIASASVARRTVLRGAEIFGLGLLFRAQEFVFGLPNSPWTDLLRVDILNLLGLSIIFMGLLCWAVSTLSHRVPTANIQRIRIRAIFASLTVATLIALLTPPLWTTWRLKFLPWPLETYINGVHTFAEPQHWLFPIFPWTAFAFAGLATGFFLHTSFAGKREALAFTGLAGAGAAVIFLSILLDRMPFHLYASYDYWHASPQFLLMRCGILLLILSLTYAWCRWGFAERGFSPLIQLGTTSLLVYWVHIEFVYGRLSILPKGHSSVTKATLGLVVIFLAMLVLSLARTRWKKSRAKASAPSSARVPAPAGS